MRRIETELGPLLPHPPEEMAEVRALLACKNGHPKLKSLE
jgi:hypothetical protein